MSAAQEDAANALSSHNYFMPMVDMLAGVIFLLVIMLASSMLVTRPEFSQVEAMQKEIARIEAELVKARAADQLYLDPRRRARAAAQLLLTRLAEDLGRAGYTATADVETGRLAIGGIEPFEADGRRLSGQGEGLTAALAETLARELPCLAAAAIEPRCADYGGARVEAVELLAAGGDAADAGQGKTGAVRLLSALAQARPGLMALTAPDGADVLTYGTGASGLGLRVRMAVPAVR